MGKRDLQLTAMRRRMVAHPREGDMMQQVKRKRISQGRGTWEVLEPLLGARAVAAAVLQNGR